MCSSPLWTQLELRQGVQLDITRRNKNNLKICKCRELILMSMSCLKMKFRLSSNKAGFLVSKFPCYPKLNSCFKQRKVLGQFWKLKRPKSITSRLFRKPEEERGIKIFWQLWAELPIEREWVQVLTARVSPCHGVDGFGAWDGNGILPVSRPTLLLVPMSLIPGHWPGNADAEPHLRERMVLAGPDGPRYFVAALASYFFAPLCAGSWYALIAQYRTRRTFKIFFI